MIWMVFILSLFNMQDHEEEKQLLLRLRKHFDPTFSQLNLLIETCLISNNRKQHLPKIRQQLEKELEQFKEGSSRPFFCGKALSSSDNKKINVYTCQECRQEFNSILCEECFEISLHEGHNYKRVQLPSGSCDCGCKSKLLEEGFCSAHEYSEEKIGQLVKRQEFRIKLHYFFKILHFLNSQITKQKVQSPDKVLLKFVDDLCASFIEQLNELNRTVKAANKTTSSLLSQKFSIGYLAEIEIREVLLSFTKLQTTAQKCVQLLNTLFLLNDSLQEQITEIYMTRHYEFFSTPYRNLSHIVFANGVLINKISKNLPLTKVFDFSHASNDHPVVQQFYNAYKSQFIILNSINSLHHECAVNCWTHAFQNGKFNYIGDYCKALETQEHHRQLNQSYYDIEKIFVEQMIKTIGIIKQQDFFHIICFQLFQKITKQPEQPSLANDLLFTYERLWATCTYALIVQKNGNFEASFGHLLYKTLRFCSRQQPIAKFSLLLDKILKYMQSSNVRPVAHQNRHYSFISVYYNNNGYVDNYGVLLSNIDAIFFKIVVRMISFLSPRDSKGTIINHKINQFIQIVFDQAQNNLYETSITHPFHSLINFVEKLHEYLYSQYSDLFLATKFQDFRKQEYYLCKYKVYLHNMLSSLSVDIIESKTFEQLVKYMLFDAPEAFSDFKSEIAQQNQQKFKTVKAKGRKINLGKFLPSLVGKITPQTQKYYNEDKININDKTYPNEKCNQNLKYHLVWSQAVERLIDILQRLDLNRMSQSIFIVNAIKKLGIYPELIYNKKRQTQKYIEALQINFFKTKQKTGKQQQLFQNFMASKYPKRVQRQQESQLQQQQFEQFQNQANGQRDQALREQQVRRNYNNHSSQLIERIELKKEQSIKSSSQSAPISENAAQFKEKCCSCNKPKESIVLPCFVSFKRVPNVFDILPDQKCLIFTSCQHFFHQDCAPKIDALGYGSCLKCSKKFNFLLILPDTYKQSQEQKCNRIIKMMDSFIKSAKLPYETQEKKQLYFRAFKSIIWFLLMISMTSNLKESDFCVYKALTKVLQVYFHSSRTFNEKEYIISKMLQVKEHSKYKDLIKYLTCIIGELIIPYQKQKFAMMRESISLSLPQRQSLIIEQVIDLCLGYKRLLPFTSFSQPEKISISELPDNLQLLTNNYKGVCQSCEKKTPKIAFVMCLHPLHQERKTEEKRCTSCIQPFISQHIRIVERENRTERYIKHEQEMLTIITDTGEIIYYAKLNKKVWALSLGSVYLDDNFNQFTVLQAIDATKIPSRSIFKLKREKYEEIVLNFYMRKHLGSGSLQVFLEQ